MSPFVGMKQLYKRKQTYQFTIYLESLPKHLDYTNISVPKCLQIIMKHIANIISLKTQTRKKIISQVLMYLQYMYMRIAEREISSVPIEHRLLLA